MTRRLLAVMAVMSLSYAEDLQVDPEEAAQRAITRSADLIAAAQDEAAVAAAQDSAWAFALPQVYARAGADRRYPLDPRSSPGFSSVLGIEQHVYTPGRWDAVAATGQARRDVARADLESVRRDAALRARLAVERVRLAKARLAVLTDRRAQREEEQADAEALYAAGRTTVTEARQSAVATAQAQDAVLGGQADLAAARRELAAAIEATDPVDARGNLVRPTGLPLLLEQARARRGPEQRALEARRRAEIGSAEQREAAARPQVFVSADSVTGGDRYDKTYANWGIGAGVRWSIYDGGSRGADAEAARAREAALSARSRSSERERERVLATLGDEIPILDGRLALAETTMAAALENYTDARERFRVGRLKLIDVGQAGLAVQESGLVQASLIAREAEIAHRLRAMAE